MAQYIFNGPQQAGDVSLSFIGRQISQISVECSVSGPAGSAVAAVVVLEGSNTGNDWIPILEASMSGTTKAVDGGIALTNWDQIRGRVVSASAGANVVCCMTSKGFPYGS